VALVAVRGPRSVWGPLPPSPLPPGGSCQPAPPCDIKGVQIQATRFFLWYLVVCGPRCRPPPPPQALYLFPSGCWEARFIYCCVCAVRVGGGTAGAAAGGSRVSASVRPRTVRSAANSETAQWRLDNSCESGEATTRLGRPAARQWSRGSSEIQLRQKCVKWRPSVVLGAERGEARELCLLEQLSEVRW